QQAAPQQAAPQPAGQPAPAQQEPPQPNARRSTMGSAMQQLRTITGG
ncbi:DUF3710 domain-containing protein, partial [Mycobacterium sp. ITM-2017-0098]